MGDLQEAVAASQKRAMDELMDELCFQRVLLQSIDHTAQDEEDATQQVKLDIALLEKRMRELKRELQPTASKSSRDISSLVSSQASSSQKTPKTPKKPKKPIAEGAVDSMDGSMNPEQSHGQSGADSTASTPNSSDTIPEITTPSSMNLVSRKRTHSKHLSGGLAPPPYGGSKSRRTSRSPYTSPATPGESSGYGYPMIGDGFFDLTMDDEFAAFDQFFQSQKAAEDQAKQQKLDEDFARSLQSDGFAVIDSPSASGPSGFNRTPGHLQASSSSSTNAHSSFANNAFDRMSGVRNVSSSSTIPSSNRENAHSASSRMLPPGWNNAAVSQTSGSGFVKSERKSMASAIKSEGGFESYSSQHSGNNFGTNLVSPFKTESGDFSSMNSFAPVKAEQKYSVPGTFQDDSSVASDSDIEIIPPSAFRDNGRHPTTSSGVFGTQHQLPNLSPEEIASGNAALRRIEQYAPNTALQQAMYGKQKRPSWMHTQSYPALPPGSISSSGYPSQQSGMDVGLGMHGDYSGDFVYPHAAYTPIGTSMKQESGLGYHVNSLSNGYDAPQPDPLLGILGRANAQSSDDPYSLDSISGHDLSGEMREQYDYIVNDPRKNNEEIKSLLQNICADVDLPAESREGTPEGLKYPLYEHQKVALTWLKSMEQGTNKGGILADDMGLGKTLSALALILTRPSADRARKTTLIVGPVALLRQWEREIRQKVNGSHRLSTKLVHGQNKKTTWDDLRNFDVVLTSYGTLGAEHKRLEDYLDKEKKSGRRDVDQTPMKKLFPMLGPKSLFYRIILDEAQCIKNKSTRSARAACTLKSAFRLCLTGTPMMNNVGELYSLIHFLRIKPYNEWQRFNSEFGMLTKASSRKYDADRAMQRLQTVLKAVLLRRTKQSQIDGKPIINLPPKTIETQHVVFSDDELSFYQALESKTQIQFNKYLRQNTVGRNYSNILVLLLRLRQACCHPHLITDFDEAPPNADNLTAEKMQELARSLLPDVVARLLEADGFECPICYDGVQNPSIIIPCGHNTCPECLASISTAAAQQNIADGNEGAAHAKCPECRGNLDSSKIIDYRTFKKVHDPNAAGDDDETAAPGISDDDSTDSESETEDEDDADSDGDLRDFIVPDDIVDTEDEEEADEEGVDKGDDEVEVEVEPKAKTRSKAKKSSKRSKKDRKGKGKEKEKKPHLSLAMMKKEASRSAKGKRQYLRYLRKHWQPSAKVDKCVDLLDQFQKEGEKTIVFSQFVSLLDLLQVPIDERGWTMERYDGGMSGDARNDAIVRFTDDPKCKIMLISLKAGNAGLNLVAASRVIILDPFWNPYIEYQAVDRAYRIGQQKPVQVHRILIEGTVEDRIIEMQKQKEKLVNAALDEGANKSLGRLDVAQLAYLFGVGR
ncbi:putative ATP-dependent helicase [Lachnellula occidentalis]|uniref:Putative ATP-dependent helicase n=1 Tax=Lachnellula occidentalis TaxID=215460 RepID=A0A8H8RX97_9HELO|nr:putative ATP-dependent helicase [Lachnellula occidentalis]